MIPIPYAPWYLGTGTRDAIIDAVARAADWSDLARRLAPLGLVIEADGTEPLELVRRPAPACPVH